MQHKLHFFIDRRNFVYQMRWCAVSTGPSWGPKKVAAVLAWSGQADAADRLTRSIGTLLPITGSFLESGGVTTNPPEKLGFRAFRT